MHDTHVSARAETGLIGALLHNFLGPSPLWYKQTLVFLLVLNPIVLYAFGPFVMGWLLILEFIFTLACALVCHPLPAGGLLVLEAIALGLVGPDTARVLSAEVANNLPVLLLLIFMVPAVAMNKELLVFIFTKVLIRVRSKTALALIFCFLGAFLSAWLDALTVTAVIIGISIGFYGVYHAYASGHGGKRGAHDHSVDHDIMEHHKEDLDAFRAFLRDIAMHGAVGTALGGVLTLVGEPQNIIIGNKMGWDFVTFFVKMAPVTIPAFFAGIMTCFLVERFRVFGYGNALPERVRFVLQEFDAKEAATRSAGDIAKLIIQGIAVCFLIIGLATHIVDVGFVGLAVLVFVSAMNGNTDEHKIGSAFAESMPFTTVIVVFLALVSVIHAQHLFAPVINWVLAMDVSSQLGAMFVANGLLSAISDNVFVALTYMSEIKTACDAGTITPLQCEKLAVAVNTGTNLPSVATPNGQAAFLFLLMSPLAKLIRLSYLKMCWMALPYTIVLSVVGYMAVIYLL